MSRRIAAVKKKPMVLSRKQRDFMALMNTPEEDDLLFAQGAVRSGKTHSALLGFVTWSRTEHPSGEFIVAAQSYTSVRRNVLRPMRRILGQFGEPYRWKEARQELHVGDAIYQFVGANTDDAQDRIQGATASGVFLDEAVLLPCSFFFQCIGRMSFDTAKIWATYNPDSPWHWFKKEVYDQLDPKVMKFTFDDNPTLGEKAKERYRRMFTGVYYARYVLGEWSAAEGAIWPNIVTAPYDYSSKLGHPVYYDVAVDYGTSSVTAALLLAHYASGHTVVVGESYHDARKSGQLVDSEVVDLIKDLIGNRTVKRVWIDPSASSLREQLIRSNLPARTANNDVLSGIRTVSTRTALDKLWIDSRCTELLEEAHGYSWNADKQRQGIDEPLKVNDHGCDALRYGIYSRLGRAQRQVRLRRAGL